MKERLTGAIVLVALIVLLVPELLTGPVRSAPRSAATPPTVEGAPLRSYTINLSDDARARSAASPASGPEQPAPLESAASSPGGAPEAPVAASDSPTPSSSAGSALPPPGKALPPGRAAPAASSESSPPSRTAPLADKSQPQSPSAASAAQVRTMRAAPARIATSPPSTAAAGSWMVQLGGFANRANAERLAREVRARGFPVSVSRGDSGRRLYRVRAGPVRDREAANALESRLEAAGHHGSVVPK